MVGSMESALDNICSQSLYRVILTNELLLKACYVCQASRTHRTAGHSPPPIVGQETGLGYTGREKCERQRCGSCLERRILWWGKAVEQINTSRTLDVNRSRVEMKVGFIQMMTLKACLFDGRVD